MLKDDVLMMAGKSRCSDDVSRGSRDDSCDVAMTRDGLL